MVHSHQGSALARLYPQSSGEEALGPCALVKRLPSKLPGEFVAGDVLAASLLGSPDVRDRGEAR